MLPHALYTQTASQNTMQGGSILITGGTAGIGRATANQLARMGARLLLVGRDREEAEAAVSEAIRSSGSKAVSFLQADMSLVSEVRRRTACRANVRSARCAGT